MYLFFLCVCWVLLKLCSIGLGSVGFVFAVLGLVGLGWVWLICDWLGVAGFRFIGFGLYVFPWVVLVGVALDLGCTYQYLPAVGFV